MAPTESEISASVHHKLGELFGTLRAVQETQRRIEDTLRRSDEKSDASRAKLHNRVDELVDRVGSIEINVSTHAADLDGVRNEIKNEIKPVTNDVRRWKIVGMTTIAIIGLGGAAMGVTFAEAIKRLIAVVLGRAI
ncbi:DUF1515 family protein [Shinella zoogloeoides]|uniref:DUF1515 family protein n=1 Tax=Shinella zoogloeoides TaxID=352475 RepID=UPI00299E66AD|nr:DUF1515 family protein [Shinella zoogloeoides]WPE19977.1 hypothetical protein ShzoTeo12_11570 [Shinella zoogloeoides]